MISAHKDLTYLAMTSALAVAPLAPLGIGQEQPDGFPLIGIGARQAVRGVGRNGVEQRILLPK